MVKIEFQKSKKEGRVMVDDLHSKERPDSVSGTTYKIKVPNHKHELVNIYITVNNLDGKPFELFINGADAFLYEHLSLTMVFISRLLRFGVSVSEIINDLRSIHSANGSHFIPKGKGSSPSLASRIGDILELHVQNTCV